MEPIINFKPIIFLPMIGGLPEEHLVKLSSGSLLVKKGVNVVFLDDEADPADVIQEAAEEIAKD